MAPQGILGQLEVLLVVLVLAEWRYRRLRWPFPALLAFYIVVHLTAFPLASTNWFRGLAIWYGAL